MIGSETSDPTHPQSCDRLAFARALLDPSLPPPCGWKARNGSDAGVRFGIYRNNVMHGLIQVLADTFPVVRQLVGEPFFRAMAGQFVREHPPASPLMHHYGAALPGWMAGFEPAAALPYLPDVARLEQARLCALHAADAEPADRLVLDAWMQAPQRLLHASLQVHPSLAVVRSSHPIVSLWHAHQFDDDARDALLGNVPLDQAESAIVFRHASGDVFVLALPEGDAELTAALAAGATLGAAQGAHPQADPARTFALLWGRGLVTALSDSPPG